MPLLPDELQKPVRKLPKIINKLSRRPAPEQVHDLRTCMRRIEATFHALMLDSRRNEQMLLKTIKPVRRKAGTVRDLDVQTAFATTLHPQGDEECVVELLEYIGAKRYAQARKLRRIARRNSPALSRRLKKTSRYLEKGFDPANNNQKSNEWPADATALALQLSGELASWPRLGPNNLHPFRLKVKELRYVLQLADNRDSELIDRLGEVKDAIGEWHDWEVLAGTAEKALGQGNGRNLIKLIRSIAKQKYDHGLSLANRLREKCFKQSERKQRKGSQRPALLPKPSIEAASSLAA